MARFDRGKNISKHLPTPVATVQGHQHQEKQILQSTKQPTPETIDIATIKRRWNKLKELKKQDNQ